MISFILPIYRSYVIYHITEVIIHSFTEVVLAIILQRPC